MSTFAFAPLGPSVAMAATSGVTSASTTLPGQGGTSARVYNAAATPVTVAFSTVVGGAVAAVTSMIFSPGITEITSIPINTTDVAVYGVGGAGTVYVQRGQGI